MNPLNFSRRGDALVGQEMFKVLDRAKLLEEQGRKIIHLELGQPRFEPPKSHTNENKFVPCPGFGKLLTSLFSRLNEKVSSISKRLSKISNRSLSDVDDSRNETRAQTSDLSKFFWAISGKNSFFKSFKLL